MEHLVSFVSSRLLRRKLESEVLEANIRRNNDKSNSEPEMHHNGDIEMGR